MSDFDDDIGDLKPFENDPEWMQVIADIQASRVCFYPGRQGNARDFMDFRGALTLIGDCDTLVFASPRHSKIKISEQAAALMASIPFSITDLGEVTEMTITDTEDDLDCLYLGGESRVEWIPSGAAPHANRFWGHHARLVIKSAHGRRKIQVLHIGMGGNAAWACFLKSKGIPVERVITSPPF
jgi:hypothetical protein